MRAREPIAWWLALFGFYLAVISTISLTELALGAVTAAAGAAAAVITRRALLSADNAERYRPRRAWPRRLAWLPVQIVLDSVLLLRPRGGFAEVELPADERAAAWRGFTALAVSASPGTYVVEVAPETNTLVVHRVSARPSILERKVTQ